MKRFIVAIVLLCVALPLTAQAGEAAHSRVLLNALRGVDTIPNAEALRQAVLPLAAEDALLSVATDGELGEYVRQRATSLLSLYPGSLSRGHLAALATGAREDRIRWTAIYTLIRSAGPAEPLAILAFSEAVLESKSASDREAVVRGLRHMDDAGAERLVTALERVEADPMVRGAIRRFHATRTR